MDALDVRMLLQTPTVELRDVCCPGLPVEPTADEFTSALRLVFPYQRGAAPRVDAGGTAA